MKTTKLGSVWTKAISACSLAAVLVVAGGSQQATAGCAIAVDTSKRIEASSKGNKSVSVLVAEARAAVTKKGGRANQWVSTSLRGYGAVAQNGGLFGYSMACGSQAQADRLALNSARGGRIIERWNDR
jgi:hypothetical protein